jgi:hypothetical protein
MRILNPIGFFHQEEDVFWVISSLKPEVVSLKQTIKSSNICGDLSLFLNTGLC